jgi:hypothetical protein
MSKYNLYKQLRGRIRLAVLNAPNRYQLVY